MVGTSVCEVLLAGPISSGVDVVPFRSEKDSYSFYSFFNVGTHMLLKCICIISHISIQ